MGWTQQATKHQTIIDLTQCHRFDAVCVSQSTLYLIIIITIVSEKVKKEHYKFSIKQYYKKVLKQVGLMHNIISIETNYDLLFNRDK